MSRLLRPRHAALTRYLAWEYGRFVADHVELTIEMAGAITEGRFGELSICLPYGGERDGMRLSADDIAKQVLGDEISYPEDRRTAILREMVQLWEQYSAASYRCELEVVAFEMRAGDMRAVAGEVLKQLLERVDESGEGGS